jgi:hypothetical protein
VTVTVTAADASNKNETPFTGTFFLYARNSGASTRSVTINSVADAVQNRTGDITENIAAGVTKTFGPFAAEGFRQSGGVLHFEAAHAEVLFSVLRVS